MIHLCEYELNYLDMGINYKKSCCLPIGLRCAVSCGNITSLTGNVPMVIRYFFYCQIKDISVSDR